MGNETPGTTESTKRAVPRGGVRIALSIVLLCVILPFGSCIGCLAIGRRVASRGQAVAGTIIQSISQPWSAPVIAAHADESFTQSVSAENLRKLVGWFDRRLGSMKSCRPVTTGDWRAFAGTSGFVVVSTYLADCEFERGNGRVTLRLVRRGERWRIQAVHVNSEALIE